MEKKVWLSRRAIKLHVVILIVVPAFLALCLWQISRALSGNTLSWAYVFEWPLFAGYAVYMWWRFVHEAAEDAPRAAMMAAPRPATAGMNVPASHSSSTCSAALRPFTWVVNRSGYWVAEWLPQMVMCSIAVTGAESFAASWETARLWSSRVMAVNRLAGTSGACSRAMRALVLAGLPTTRTLMSLAA